MANAVAKAKSAELSTDVMDDIFADGGEGASFDSSELQIPFIRLAQQMSPQINKKDASFIEGLSSGDIFNNLTNEIYDGETGIQFVPCYVITKYKEFVPRDEGGGFVQELDPSDPDILKTKKNGTKDVLPSGNELVTADEYYGLVLGEDGDYQMAVIDMKVSQMKVSRRWKSQIAMNKAKNPKTGQMQILPIYSTIWQLTTVDETNKRNETFSNYAVSKVGMVKDRSVYEDAKIFRQSVASGDVKAKDVDQVSVDEEPKDEIPF